jgi:hypothetical protein
MKRLLYVDTLRGAAILLIILVHAVGALVFKYDAGTARNLTLSPAMFAALFPLGILGTWAPLFVMLSGTAHAYSTYGHLRHDRALPGQRDPLWSSYLGAIANSGVIYAYSLVNMLFLHHSMEFNGTFQHTMITSSIQDGTFYPPSVEFLFYNDALATIAVSAAVVNTVLFLLWRNGGFEKHWRNYIMLGAMMLLFFFTARDLHERLDGAYYQAITEGEYLKAFLLKSIIGANQSPFPNVGYGFIGAILGVALARGESLKAIKRFGFAVAGCCLLMCAMQFATEGLKPADLVSHTLPMKLHHLNMGLMLLMCTWLIAKMEYQSEQRRVILARRTILLRRFSMAALSVFLLEGVVATSMSRAFAYAWDGGAELPRNPVMVAAFLAILLVFWDASLRLWERRDFKYGFEWYLIRVVDRVRGRHSERLLADKVLHQPAARAVRAA